MEQNDFIQKFGYSELYEWYNQPPQDRLGNFVSFSKEDPKKIVKYGENVGAEVLGVTTISSTVESDNPSKWRGAALCNEFGDLYLRKEKLAVGQKVYDEVLELNYVRTRPWEHFITVPSENYDTKREYVPRTNRPEWIKVNILGKCIVKDNGECIPGQYCRPYDGKLKVHFGEAVPAENDWKGQKFYVIERFSKNTIMILMR